MSGGDAAQEPACGWLLLLGSSRPTDDTLRAAVAELGGLGSVRQLTPVQRFPSYTGEAGRWYFNALAEWQGALPRAALHARLRAIEAALGRRRDVAGEVAIDLDILAARRDGVWRADPHALAKGDLVHPTTRELLRLAGVTVA